MEPALRNGTVLFVNKLAFGFRLPFSMQYIVRWAQPESGDILVFWTPLSDFAVKRCAAILDGNKFFALGDNAPASFDSRSYGPIPQNNIIGRVLLPR